MSPEYEKLLHQALALPVEDRHWLLAQVEASLAEPMDKEVEEAWAAAVDQRVDEHKRGEASFITWEELQVRLQTKLQK